MNKTFCSLPWVSIAVDTDGSCKPCCISLDTMTKPDGTNWNLGTDKITDIFNSPAYVTMREKMLHGEVVPGCNRCYQMEKIGNKSHREVYNEVFRIPVPKPSADLTIKYFDLRFGNLCNLNCRSCSPKNSSQLAKEVSEITNPAITKFHPIGVMPPTTWYEQPIYEENIRGQYDNIETIYMTGGEPTIIQKNMDTMADLIATGHSKNITLKFNSNMTNTSPKFYKMITEFKSVIFFASVDGYGSMQEYLRFPSKWIQIDNNLCKLINLSPAIRIKPSPVIQITNLNKITELFEYFENHNRLLGRCAFDINPIILELPEYLNISYLPTDFAIQSWETIEEWMKGCKYQTSAFRATIAALKTKCYQAKEDKFQLDKYIEYNSIFDNHRNSFLKDANPELCTLLQHAQ